MHRDPEIGKVLVGGNDIRACDPAAHAERDDRRMFQEQQEVGDSVGSTLFDEILLERQGFVVSDQPEAPHLEGSHVSRSSRVDA